MRPLTAVVVVALLLAGCRAGGVNYPDSGGPRHADGPAEPPSSMRDSTGLHVVSYNIAFARHIDSAIELLSSHPDLQGADVILLQEMDEPGTRRIADALGREFVYYAAVRSRRSGRDFGNAVLSAWPIVHDEKLILPHTAVLRGTQRIATVATVQFGDTPIRVYSTHLGTPIEIGSDARRDQLRFILDDAEAHPHVVVGGDMNSHGVGEEAVSRGYLWLTREGPRTTLFGRWDHVFLRGFAAPDSNAAGTVLDARDASDHRPVWVRAVIRD